MWTIQVKFKHINISWTSNNIYWGFVIFFLFPFSKYKLATQSGLLGLWVNTWNGLFIFFHISKIQYREWRKQYTFSAIVRNLFNILHHIYVRRIESNYTFWFINQNLLMKLKFSFTWFPFAITLDLIWLDLKSMGTVLTNYQPLYGWGITNDIG